MNSRTYTLQGPPIPWKRAGRSGNKYYDQQSFEKERIRMELLTQKPHRVESGPIYMTYRFYLPIANSLSDKKKKALESQAYDMKPDIDNLYKFYSDAFEGILYTNDCQIAQVHLAKLYALTPRTEIMMEWLE